MCTKCKNEPRANQDKDATNRHCSKCRTEAAANYRATVLEQENGKGFGKGVAAMREIVVNEFELQGGGMFSGWEIGVMVRQMPGPLPKDKSEPPTTED